MLLHVVYTEEEKVTFLLVVPTAVIALSVVVDVVVVAAVDFCQCVLFSGDQCAIKHYNRVHTRKIIVNVQRRNDEAEMWQQQQQEQQEQQKS